MKYSVKSQLCDCFVSAGAARLLLLQHGADLIAGRIHVNYAGGSASSSPGPIAAAT
jgi:hypothetical protein